MLLCFDLTVSVLHVIVARLPRSREGNEIIMPYYFTMSPFVCVYISTILKTIGKRTKNR